MLIFQGRWSNLELDRVMLYLLIELRAWFASIPLHRAIEKGNNNTTRTPVPFSQSATYVLLVRVDSNNG